MQKLSAKKRKELRSLASRPDREIDLSDIPEIQRIPPDAVIGKFYRPKKTSVTIRLNADVIAWLKATGEGYDSNQWLSPAAYESKSASRVALLIDEPDVPERGLRFGCVKVRQNALYAPAIEHHAVGRGSERK